MTQSCSLGWFKSCCTTDFSSPGSSHTVTQLPLHHSRMTFTKWLHVLVCVCLGTFSHPKMLQRGPLHQVPEAGKFHAVRSRFTQSDTSSPYRACPEQTQDLASITQNYKATRGMSWSWELPSQWWSCLSRHHSWKATFITWANTAEAFSSYCPEFTGHMCMSQFRHAESWISSLLPVYLICDKTSLGLWGWGFLRLPLILIPTESL